MSPDNSRWVYPAGSTAAGGRDVVIDDRIPGWRHTGLTTLTLTAGSEHRIELGGNEAVLVPLAGGVAVAAVDGTGDRQDAVLAGRASVFDGPTDIAYVPAGSVVTLTAAADCRVAVATAAIPAGTATAGFRHLPADAVPVELRGAGQCSREVRNFGTPDVLDAGRIIACEVITPGGNWSSYPPHKHDVERPGIETQLEEIYYFEVQRSAAGPEPDGSPDPVGYQRVYASDERPIDVLAEVRTGDVVLVPYGWHGPAMAVPGYDLYYLNVMAGPGAHRAWLICDDPAHGWIRQTWAEQPVDPRLPLGTQGPGGTA